MKNLANLPKKFYEIPPCKKISITKLSKKDILFFVLRLSELLDF